MATVVTTQVAIPEFENYVGLSTGTFTVPTSGTWTFGVSTDEGYRLTVTRVSDNFVMGTTSWTTTATTGFQPTTTFYTISGLATGTNYSVKLEWLNSTGASEVELFSALGTYTSWADSTGTAYPWCLVGDTSGANSGYQYGTSVTGDAAYGLAAILGTNPTGPAPSAYWQFNETSGATIANAGSGGTGWAGALTSNFAGGYTLGVAGPTGAFGNPNNAIAFASSNQTSTGGTGGWMNITSNGQPLNNLSAFTVGGWIDPTVTPYAWEGIMGHNGMLSIGFYNSTTLMVQTNFGSITASYTYGANSWHYVSVVCDANASDGHYAKLYIDGSVAGYTTTAPTGGNWGSTPPMYSKSPATRSCGIPSSPATARATAAGTPAAWTKWRLDERPERRRGG